MYHEHCPSCQKENLITLFTAFLVQACGSSLHTEHHVAFRCAQLVGNYINNCFALWRHGFLGFYFFNKRKTGEWLTSVIQ